MLFAIAITLIPHGTAETSTPPTFGVHELKKVRYDQNPACYPLLSPKHNRSRPSNAARPPARLPAISTPAVSVVPIVVDVYQNRTTKGKRQADQKIK